MIYKAYEIQNKIKCGLILSGQNQDVELEWVGTGVQWNKVENLNKEYNI